MAGHLKGYPPVDCGVGGDGSPAVVLGVRGRAGSGHPEVQFLGCGSVVGDCEIDLDPAVRDRVRLGRGRDRHVTSGREERRLSDHVHVKGHGRLRQGAAVERSTRLQTDGGPGEDDALEVRVRREGCRC